MVSINDIQEKLASEGYYMVDLDALQVEQRNHFLYMYRSGYLNGKHSIGDDETYGSLLFNGLTSLGYSLLQNSKSSPAKPVIGLKG